MGTGRKRSYIPMAAAALLAVALPETGEVTRLMGTPQKGKNSMISYSIEPERNEFTAEEEIRIVVRIENQTATPIDIVDPGYAGASQPSYHLKGPGFKDGITFSRASRLPEGVPEGGGTRIKIAPKGEHTVTVPLSEMVTPRESGVYELTSRLEWNGTSVSSAPVSFQIVPLEIASIHVGAGVPPFGAGEGEGAFLRRGKEVSYLYRFRYIENRPGISEAKVDPPTPPEAVGLDAADIGVPWSNGGFFAEMIQWVVWREGLQVRAMATTAETVSLALPEAPVSLVRPPLRPKGGPIDVLAVSADSTRLTLVRFPARSKDRMAAPSSVWTAALPAKPQAITAALAPAALGSQRHVAFVAAEGKGIAIHHSRYAETGALEPFLSAQIDSGELIENSPPAMYVDNEGTAHVAVLAVSAARGETGKYRCALVETLFKPGGEKPAKPSLTPLAAALDKPSGAAILYHGPEVGPRRRETVVQVAEKLLHAEGTSALAPVTVEGRPTKPIALLPGKEKAYILYFEPGRGFYLEPL